MPNDFPTAAVAPLPKRKPRRDEAIEPGRLARSLPLGWVKIGERQYKVAGNKEPFYYVDLSLDVPCTCDDALKGGHLCKHAMRAMTVERDPAIFDQVLQLYERQIQHERESMPRTKRRRRTAGQDGE